MRVRGSLSVAEVHQVHAPLEICLTWHGVIARIRVARLSDIERVFIDWGIAVRDRPINTNREAIAFFNAPCRLGGLRNPCKVYVPHKSPALDVIQKSRSEDESLS
jgi:hypothetical protein